MIAGTLLGQVDAGMVFIAVAKRCDFLDERRTTCIGFAKRAAGSTEAALWRSKLEPEDLMEISAEVERLRFEIQALS